MKFKTLGRHVREGSKNIVRNGWMTFAAISAVTVTLLILGVFLLLAMNINHIVEVVEDQVEITVELDLNVTEEQIDSIDNEIRNIDGVKSITYISKEEGLELLKEQMGEDSYLLEGLDEENPLADTFVVQAVSPQALEPVSNEIAKIHMVTEVDYGKITVEKLLVVTKWIRNLGIVFIVGLAFTAMFLISNTIKITIYARRKEIEIMKLVGATNWFIRWPFFIEGLLLGILGSIAPIAILVLGYKFLLDQLGGNLVFSIIEFLPLYPLAYQISFLLVSIGAFIGVWGSMMSVRRFLKI